MQINQYLDSTYLKTAEQAGISEKETWEKVKKLTQEAIENQIFAVMIRPHYVKDVRKILDEAKSNVKLGTVISFPEGNLSTEDKIAEADTAIENGADELDFVINYHAFLSGNTQGIADEVKACNEFVLSHGKTIKWIIETAALNPEKIAQITSLISNITENNFPEHVQNVFVKSSTGFYETNDGTPNGATTENIKIMLENAGKLPTKAAGGVRTYQEAVEMINLGVKRIGTSSALAIINGNETNEDY